MGAINFLKKEAFRFPLSAACGYALGKLVNANPYITAGAVVVSCFVTSIFRNLFLLGLNKLYLSTQMKNKTKVNFEIEGTLLIKSIVSIGTTLILQARVTKSALPFYAFPILLFPDFATEIITKPIYNYLKSKNKNYDLYNDS